MPWYFARENSILANFNRLEFFAEGPSYLHPIIDEVLDLVLRGNERKAVFKKLKVVLVLVEVTMVKLVDYKLFIFLMIVLNYLTKQNYS